MNDLELPPIGTPFPFTRPFDGSSIVIPTVLVAELDYFYWPCLSGEKYGPAFAATINGVSSGYSTSGTGLPTVRVSADGQSLAQSVNPGVTWPNIPGPAPRYGTFRGWTATWRSGFMGLWSSNLANTECTGFVTLAGVQFVQDDIGTGSGASMAESFKVDGTTVATSTKNATTFLGMHSWQVSVTAAGLMTATLDGAVVRSGFTPSVDPTTANVSPALGLFKNNNAASYHLAGLTVTYS